MPARKKGEKAAARIRTHPVKCRPCDDVQPGPTSQLHIQLLSSAMDAFTDEHRLPRMKSPSKHEAFGGQFPRTDGKIDLGWINTSKRF